jgi:hypothetical protein
VTPNEDGREVAQAPRLVPRRELGAHSSRVVCRWGARQYASFDSFNQLAACMLVMPPIVTYLEATAPHTMDSPVLMAGSGIVLLCILYSL